MKNDESLALAYRGDSTAPCENYWMQNNEMGCIGIIYIYDYDDD